MVTAGTSDGPVAEEACETLIWMGVQVVAIRNISVAGPRRLPAQLERGVRVDAAVVVAGIGKRPLPSVVGGYVPCPVIAVCRPASGTAPVSRAWHRSGNAQ